ncbi:hypothetical protein [Streptomyces sp. WAC00263]|uniref:hypothetical protein n=1 Tax=Streptomyces sp. WAC00263 TaxID=1917422 RepID=UPI0015EF1912|nr:hypothetical protein [Streptomyces sp. WAC00263]KAF5992376.1 hypothetical protein BOG92_011365 [Streptomyces sp. WAC00263]
MIGVLVAGFLIAHGLLHPGIWAAPVPADRFRFDPGRSWALTAVHASAAPARAAALALAWYTALLYVVAGAGAAVSSGWWPGVAIVAASSGLALKALWFHPWLAVGVLLDVGAVVAVICSWPGSLH